VGKSKEPLSEVQSVDRRLWWRRPEDWRDDSILQSGDTTVCVAQGDRSSVYFSATNTLYRYSVSRPRRSLFQRLTNRRVVPRVVQIDQRLSETPFVLSPSRIRGWELVAGGREEVAGRAMIRVLGNRIDAAASLGPVSQVSACDLLVDEMRGVVLRFAGMIEGEVAFTMTVTSVQFDEPLSDDTFVLRVPPSARLDSIFG
jgi:outer membrane lipoprotein-sorting protein